MVAPIRSLPPPTKKRKLQKDSGFVDSVQQLENKLTDAVAANSSLNPLADLLDLTFNAHDPQDTSKGIYAIYRVFVVAITNGKFGLGGDDAAKVVKAWLWDRLNAYVDFLCGLLKDEEKFLRISALQILFSLLKHLSTSSTKSLPSSPQFHISHFRKIASSLILCPPSKRPQASGGPANEEGKLDADVRDLFIETWLSVHDDIRWFFLREAASILSASPLKAQPYSSSNLLSILERINTFPTDPTELNAWWVTELGTKPPKPKHVKRAAGVADEDSEDESDAAEEEEEEDDWRKFFDEDTTTTGSKPKTPSARLHKLTIHQSLHSLPSHRAVFTRAWLILLPRLSVSTNDGINKTLSMRALNVMHRGVLPHLTRPVLVMDWVGACVDFGGTVGLLALNALFILMKEYNLDYPSFYTRLYAFLDRDVLHLKHRARFFRMTELFLSSTHIPATLLASFIKRLARLSLNAPPPAIIMIIPFTYNILKRHPSLMPMIHRSADELDGDAENMDPFLPLEPNPLLTQAIGSSLWELHTHKSHYHSAVSTLAKIFEEAFTKPGYSMEDFLDHTYGTLFDTEAHRKIKKEPALAGARSAAEVLFPVRPVRIRTDSVLGKEDEGSGEIDVDVDGGVDLVSELWVFG